MPTFLNVQLLDYFIECLLSACFNPLKHFAEFVRQTGVLFKKELKLINLHLHLHKNLKIIYQGN